MLEDGRLMARPQNSSCPSRSVSEPKGHSFTFHPTDPNHTKDPYRLCAKKIHVSFTMPTFWVQLFWSWADMSRSLLVDSTVCTVYSFFREMWGFSLQRDSSGFCTHSIRCLEVHRFKCWGFFFPLSLSCLEALFSELLTVGVKAVLGHRRLPALIIWLFKAEAKSLSSITVSSNRYYHLTSPKWPSRERNLSHRLQEQMWVVSKSSQQLKDRGWVSVCKTQEAAKTCLMFQMLSLF